MAVQYIASLADPFDSTLEQPKLLDGAVARSSGLRFRNTGNITLDAAGGDNFIALFPGFAQGLTWKRPADAAWVVPTPYPSHLGTTTDRANVRRFRLVSSGLRLSLMNSADDNEGYWEAIRIPIENLAYDDTLSPYAENYIAKFISTLNLGNFSNYQTYQTGLLKDISRYQFKLNSVSAQHGFTVVDTAVATDTVFRPEKLVDQGYDCVVIRLVGRTSTTVPTMIMYNHVSNQEVIYKDDTIMARLATPNIMISDLPSVLDKTRYVFPSIQIT